MNKKNKILLSVALITTGLLTSCNHQFYSSNTANNPAITTSNIDSNTKPISMKINGLKENYGLGSLIDLSNLIVVVSFDNNTTKEFSMYNANITYDSFDTDTLGLHKIKIKYNDFEQEFEYNVKNINLTLDFNGGLFDGKNTYELPARKNIVSLEGIIPSLNEEGKKFAGWFYDKDLTNRVEFAIQNELSINDDITIYAGYDNDYTSIFDYEVINNEVRLIKLKYENIVNEIQIPKTIDLYPVTIIGENFAYIDDPWACDEIDTIKFDQDSCVKIIENNAFYDLSQLVNCSLPDTIEKIGDYAFFCTQIKTLILPKNLKSIGNYAFAFCINLENVYFNESNLISIGNYAFSYCSELNEFEFSNKLEIIGTNAFENCIKFKKINLPASLETVGLNTFSGLPNLEAINVDKNNKKFKSIDGNLYSYDETIFYRYSYGKKDKEFIMPSNVKFIYDGAFNVYNEIIYLENLVLNEGLIEIGDLVFENTKIDFTIPSTVNFIGQKAFYGWNGKEFKISPNNKKYGVLNKSLVCYKESDGKKTCMLYAIPGGYEDDNYILNENIEKIDSYVCSTLNISSFIIPVDSKLNEIEDNALNLTAFPNLKYLYIKKKVPFKIYND